jgi:hypothetical protein
MRWRSGETVAEGAGVETFMILLLLMTEADCLDHQHRRVTGATINRQRRRSAYRASGLVHRPVAADRVIKAKGSNAVQAVIHRHVLYQPLRRPRVGSSPTGVGRAQSAMRFLHLTTFVAADPTNLRLRHQ